MQNINGILLLDKPSGITSNRALQRVRSLIKAKKGGHTGSHDPFATGMLPLCFGVATKISHYLLNEKKTYSVEVKFGVSTSTGDIDGEITGNSKIKEYSEDQWKKILNEFKGKSEQIPPMYSALRYKGKRLYELARKGEIVDRAARKIHIFSIDLVDLSKDTINFEVTCSKGTYIRSIARDLGNQLGCGGHLSELIRTSQQNFSIDNANKIDIVSEDNIISLENAFDDLNTITLNKSDTNAFINGVTLKLKLDHDNLLRVYDSSKNFIAIGKNNAQGFKHEYLV